MFKSMTGPNWGFTSNDVINYIPSPIHDIDLHIDHRKCVTNEKFSEIISRHNLIFDPIRSTKVRTRTAIYHFLKKYLTCDDYNSIFEQYMECLQDNNIDKTIDTNLNNEKCFIILIDIIYKNKLLLLNNSQLYIDESSFFFTSLEDNVDNDVYNSNFNKIVVDLKFNSDHDDVNSILKNSIQNELG